MQELCKYPYHRVNTLKLWLPQIFTAISNYQQSHNGSTSNLCEMLTAIEGIITHVNETIVEQPECVVVRKCLLYFMYSLENMH